MELERQRERDRLEAERQEAEVARRKLQQEQDRKQEEKQRGEARKQKEEERRKEAERKRLAEMEEERRKTEALAQKRESAVLAGRLGPTRAMKPTLLGAAKGPESSSGSSSDKVIKEVKIRKEEDTPLNVAVEGGVGSPLGDKIVVSDVYHGGAVDANAEIRRGDQILEINGHSLSDMTSAEVEEFLWEAEQKCPPGGYIRFLIAESEMRANQDEVTYF